MIIEYITVEEAYPAISRLGECQSKFERSPKALPTISCPPTFSYLSDTMRLAGPAIYLFLIPVIAGQNSTTPSQPVPLITCPTPTDESVSLSK